MHQNSSAQPRSTIVSIVQNVPVNYCSRKDCKNNKLALTTKRPENKAMWACIAHAQTREMPRSKLFRVNTTRNIKSRNACTERIQGRGNRGVRGSNDPIYLGVKHGILTPRFLKEIFSGTQPHGIYIIIISETRSRTVFFVIIYNRFVDSSTCGPRDFDPPLPQSKNSSRAPERMSVVTNYKRLNYIAIDANELYVMRSTLDTEPNKDSSLQPSLQPVAVTVAGWSHRVFFALDFVVHELMKMTGQRLVKLF